MTERITTRLGTPSLYIITRAKPSLRFTTDERVRKMDLLSPNLDACRHLGLRPSPSPQLNSWVSHRIPAFKMRSPAYSLVGLGSGQHSSFRGNGRALSTQQSADRIVS